MSQSDDIWGERRNSRHDNKVMGDASFRIHDRDPSPNHLPALILIMLILAAIVAVLYAAAGLVP